MAVAHRLHEGRWPQDSVTAGEYARDPCCQGVVTRDPPAGARQSLEVGGLADGDDDRIRLDGEVRPLDRLGARPPARVGLAQLHPEAFHADHRASIITDHADRAGEQMEPDPLLLGEADLLIGRRHLGARPPVHDCHLVRTQPEGGARRVHRRVSAADDGGPLANANRLAQVHASQEVERVHHAAALAPLDVEPEVLVGAAGDEGSGVALAAEAVQRHVAPDPAVQPHLDAVVQQLVDLEVQHVSGEPVLGNAQAQHPAQEGHRLEDRHPVSRLAQVVGSREAGRAAPDDRDSFFPRFRRGLLYGGLLAELIPVGIDPVGGEALQVANGDRLVDIAPVALALAGMLADATADCGQRAALADEIVGLLEPALADKGDVALDVDPGRAGVLAGRGAIGLRDAVDVGDRLREGSEDGLSLPQPAVELAGQRHRADLGAVAAGVALLEVHVARIPPDPHLEVARLARHALDIGQRDDLDVLVAPALDELGRQDARRAVAGGEGLVQLGHPAADGSRALDEVHLEAGFGQVERGLNAGDACPVDEHCAGW